MQWRFFGNLCDPSLSTSGSKTGVHHHVVVVVVVVAAVVVK